MLIKSKFIILALCAVALVGCASQTRTEGGPPAQDPSGTGAGVPEQGAPQGEALPGARADLLAKRRVYFAFDSSSLDDENRAIVEAHAQYLAANPNVKVHLEGHCDERGTREYNLALGERRAKAVERMIRVMNVGGARLSTATYGEEKPVANGHDESAWRQNRRVELIYR